ncbi:hypothetical protein KX928_14105 [Roseobacter sp. YSTF-M11]|uniref:Glycosyl transferase family 28 C-terminal domain-containing protein n=1 Tax=Roseobacter insulae TaxID=2859783 RepID=A0A9X1FWF2_9RHOB|nr:glycosyltransferase [Roseobacter insulae]MBW4708918.1 hypothetical protein [Roseobacter insulae]
MILLCSGQISSRHFDALLLFAAQLESGGHSVAIDARFMPEETIKQQKYEMAPFLADAGDINAETILVIGAEAMSDDAQILLRGVNARADVPVWAIGHYATHQDEINARNKIAFAMGREPELLNLSKASKPLLLEGLVAPLATRIAPHPEQSDGKGCKLLVYMPFEMLEEDDALTGLAITNYSPNVELHVLTNAKGKDLIRRSKHAALSVFGYGELPPDNLLNYFDVAAFFGSNIPGERMAALALLAMGSGKVVIDCTTTAGFAETGAPVVRGPDRIEALSGYLHDVVMHSRVEIGRRSLQSSWLKQFDAAALEREVQLTHLPRVQPDPVPQTVFFPTNGNGLGHAQRCALIADAMQDETPRRFAAFPSCIDMLENRGFGCVPMVPRSDDHGDAFAADLVNYIRLRQLLRPGDRVVFDGGYVFDSIYRTVSALKLSATWIRRGLWRPGQINPTALERERAFSQVIVPQEAFAELNSDYSTGHHIDKVGPIVRQGKLSAKEVQSLRDRLSIQFDQEIDTLVVTMLGGGVASERTAQTQMLCSLLEQRTNCLHLIVAWPNAVVAPGLAGWRNSHVVYTTRTLALCQAADLTVSAVGYNSFHEILYAQVPSILIPQSAPFLDDQERRARAAAERNLAALVLETELLALEREVSAFLDGAKADEIRKALAAECLPDTGNVAAARLIEQGG